MSNPSHPAARKASRAAKAVDVVDGIPDRHPRPALWKNVLIGLIFIAWLAVLIYCWLAGQ